jgi:hypothetical protein
MNHSRPACSLKRLTAGAAFGAAVPRTLRSMRSCSRYSRPGLKMSYELPKGDGRNEGLRGVKGAPSFSWLPQRAEALIWKGSSGSYAGAKADSVRSASARRAVTSRRVELGRRRSTARL